MAFCTHCGSELKEGVAHQCKDGLTASHTEAAASMEPEPESERSAPLPTGPANAKTSSSVQFDGQVLLNLLRNPMNALNLQGDQTGLIYGLIGIISSIIGFWLFGLGVRHLFYSGWGIMSLVGGNIGLGSSSLLLGLFSTVILLGSFWFTGNMITKKKLDIKDFIAKIGSFQLLFGVVLIVSGLLSFMSLKLAFLVLIFALLAALAANSAVVIQLYQVSSNQLIKFIGMAIGIYTVLLAIVYNVLL
ncbi:hypothetical protein [Paenibacillus solani]|uniref:Yip1 domain-containing protein n=1 Tax=Paenibacillus solani TaxID=1705565 RepID=A0A0M1P0S6_9BACL|nr:hypothetical protein [Paenibacillus solani]KOR88113.1 hypothetical protein AM231_02445 [Paenibacillus solani]